jgi:cell division protein FtsB
MKDLWSRIPRIFKSFYFLIAVFFLAWMLFIDDNDFISQVRWSKKEAQLEKTKAYYKEKITEVKADREALMNDEDLLEKIAREKYLMKKKNEEVFVVVEEK